MAKADGGLALVRLVERQDSLWDGGAPLWLNPLPDAAGLVPAFAGFAQRLDHARQQGIPFGEWFVPEKPVPAAIVTMSKGKERAQFLLSMAAAAVAPGGLLALVGETRLGIRSATQLFAELGLEAGKLAHGGHGALWAATVNKPVLAPVFPEGWESVFDGPAGLRLCALPGVFASGRLDDATAILLGTLESAGPLDGRKVLDFGCGCGVITAFAVQGGASVTAVDVDALALAATKRTLALNGLEATVLASDGLSDVTGSFDLILSNPPFHDGASVDLGVAERFFADAKQRLKRGGRLRIVANRFLPYREPIERAFGAVVTVYEDTRFQVLEAVNAVPARRP
ncbi:methyltransferase [Radicibacter daui]|uniref:methyltransferase n=1 Tax=Radicibacter daui TaxID=3064829 RepID=UPI004046A78F